VQCPAPFLLLYIYINILLYSYARTLVATKSSNRYRAELEKRIPKALFVQMLFTWIPKKREAKEEEVRVASQGVYTVQYIKVHGWCGVKYAGRHFALAWHTKGHLHACGCECGCECGRVWICACTAKTRKRAKSKVGGWSESTTEAEKSAPALARGAPLYLLAGVCIMTLAQWFGECCAFCKRGYCLGCG
jgi:hypothetical protein